MAENVASARSISGLVARLKDARAGHRTRHRASGYDFAIADNIDSLNPEFWDEVTADASFFLRRPYRRLLETSGPADVKSRYALVLRDRRPVAAVAAQLVTIAATQLAAADAEADSASKRSAPKVVRRAALSRLRERVLVCGNLFSWGCHGVAVRAGEDRAAVWVGVAEALYRMRRAERLVAQTDYVLVKDFDEDDATAAEALRPFSYRPVETDPDMVLDLDPAWAGYDDYLASLNSRYRKAARKIESEVTDAGYVVEPLVDLWPVEDHLQQLYLQVQRRAQLRLAALPSAYLPALATLAGPELFRCTVVRRDGVIVGFVTTIRDRETAIGYYIGFDDAENAQVPIYLRLLQAVIADAIALGARRLSLGRTALEPKSRLGATPRPLHVWIRHRLPLVNVLFRPLLEAVPHDKAPERNPFR